jgi:MYXO-CTERM domain-containing protein
VTSEGDQSCTSYGQDTRVDAHASWIDATMKGWGDPLNVPIAEGGCGCGVGGTEERWLTLLALGLLGARRRRR